jgi:hypothetical protein
LKRAKKLLPYINIGEANKGMARAIKIKKRREEGGKNTPTPEGEKHYNTEHTAYLLLYVDDIVLTASFLEFLLH